MSRKLTRLVLAGSIAVGASVAPTLAAHAVERTVVVKDNKFDEGRPEFQIEKGDTVRWEVQDGEHNVTPDDPARWPAKEGSQNLEKGDVYALDFPTGGLYGYHCTIHSEEMKGVINVKDLTPSSSSTTTTTAPPTTTTTRPAVVQPGPTTTTTSAPASSAGTKPPGSAAPAPTTTTTKPSKDNKKKDEKPKEEETTTTTAPPPPPGPVDIPDEAIIPVLPGSQTGTTTQNGGIEAPGSTPEGDAIALLKSKKGGGGKAAKLLIVSGLGLGVLGLGTAGYKWANRSSRYFPA